MVYKLFRHVFKRLGVLFLLINHFAPCYVFAENFPKLTLFTIGGGTCVFPSQKNELVFLGFRLTAKEELFSWYKSLIRNKINLKNINCTVLPVLPSWMSLYIARKHILALCQNKLPQEAMPYVKITFCNEEKLANKLGLFSDNGDLEHIHVYFLDEQGSICWHATGNPTSDSIQQCKKAIRKD